jgi:hypothetical protein
LEEYLRRKIVASVQRGDDLKQPGISTRNQSTNGCGSDQRSKDDLAKFCHYGVRPKQVTKWARDPVSRGGYSVFSSKPAMTQGWNWIKQSEQSLAIKDKT